MKQKLWFRHRSISSEISEIVLLSLLWYNNTGRCVHGCGGTLHAPRDTCPRASAWAFSDKILIFRFIHVIFFLKKENHMNITWRITSRMRKSVLGWTVDSGTSKLFYDFIKIELDRDRSMNFTLDLLALANVIWDFYWKKKIWESVAHTRMMLVNDLCGVRKESYQANMHASKRCTVG